VLEMGFRVSSSWVPGSSGLQVANSAISLGAIVISLDTWLLRFLFWFLLTEPDISSCWISRMDIVSTGTGGCRSLWHVGGVL
jgi:hypothetical protein